MSALGRLVASISLDSSEFGAGSEKAQLEAARLAAAVDKQMKVAEDAVSTFSKRAAGYLAAGFSIAGMAKLIDSTVEARAALEKLSTTTGASVEALSKISVGAKLAGVDMTTVGDALVKLTKGLSASNSDTKDTARALEYLGVSGRNTAGQLRDPGDVMLEVAQKISLLKDGSNKTAIALALFGKSGAQMLPVLKDLAENGDLVAKITAKQAMEAEAYEKAIMRLSAAQSAAGKKVAGDFIVPLTTLFQVLTDNMNATDSLNGSVNRLSRNGELQGWAENSVGALAEFAKVVQVLSGNVAFVFSGIATEAKGMAAQLVALGKGDFSGFLEIGKIMKTEAAQARADFDKWEAKIMNSEAFGRLLNINKLINQANAGAFEDQNDRREASKLRGEKNFRGTDHDVKESAFKAENAALDAQLARLKGVGELEAYITKLQEDRFAKLTPKQRDTLIEKEKEIIAIQQTNALRAMQLKSDTEFAEALEKISDLTRDYSINLRDQNKNLEYENSLIGLSADEIAKSNKLRQMDLDLRRALEQLGSGKPETEAALIRANNIAKEQVSILLDTGKALRDNQSLWTDVADRGSRFFVDMVSSGKNAFTTLTDSLKSFGKELLAFFAKRWILQIAAGVTGSTALAAQAAGMGNGSLIGSLGNAIGGGSSGGLGSLIGNGIGLLGSGASALGLSGLGGSLGAFGAGLAGQGGTVAMLTTNSTAYGLGSSMAAAGPYVLAALAAYAAYNAFRDKGENPRYRLGFGSSAQAYASSSIFGQQGFQYAEGNDAANQATRQYQQSFSGLDSLISGFMSPSQIAAATARLNGTTGREFSFPKGDPTASEQLSLEYLKLKYSAVFADFNSQISNTIANFSGKSEDLIKYIGDQVSAYDALNKMITQITGTIDGLAADPLTQFQQQLDALRDSVTSAMDAYREAQAANDPTKQLTAQQELLTAIQNRYNTEMGLIKQLTDQLDQIRTGRFDFNQSISSRLTGIGRGPSAQATSNTLISRLGSLQDSANAATDPQARINYINQALSVVDTWVGSQRDAITARFAAQTQAQQNLINLQSKAIDTRIKGLQTELNVAQQMGGLVDSIRNTINSIKYSGANPLSAYGQLSSQGSDIASLQAQFRSASGADKANIANQLVAALQGRLASAGQGDLLQRPSDAYLQLYNETMAGLAEVQDSAKSDAARALDLQASIEKLTQDQNDLLASQVDYTDQMNTELGKIYDSAEGLYLQFQQQGDAAYEQMARNTTAQLNAIGTSNQLLTDIRTILTAMRDGTSVQNGSRLIRDNRLNDGTTPIVVQIDGAAVATALLDNSSTLRRELARG